jgi:hypothetical protein
MQLSVVIPTNRDSLQARARLLSAATWASERVEIIIRDNSGSAGKLVWLGGLQATNCRVESVEPCAAYENFAGALALSSGEFVLFLGDDDACFDRGVAALALASEQHAGDSSVAGLTGAYALEERSASRIVSYTGVDSSDVLQRLDGYLGYQGPNLIFYSAMRRGLAVDAFGFMAQHPLQAPFHDNLYSLIYLLAGRVLNVGRLTFIYDNANWDAVEAGVASDLKQYAAAGVDPIMRKLHWLLCGFEGAWLATRSRFGAARSPAERQAVAVKWFDLMFRRFSGDANQSFGSTLADPAAATTQKLLRSYPNFSLDALLDDICDFITLFSAEKAEAYRDFWLGVAAESGL